MAIDSSFAHFMATPAGQTPEFLFFPSAKDPHWSERYPGKATIEIVAPCKPEWFSEWLGTTRGQAR